MEIKDYKDCPLCPGSLKIYSVSAYKGQGFPETRYLRTYTIGCHRLACEVSKYSTKMETEEGAIWCFENNYAHRDKLFPKRTVADFSKLLAEYNERLSEYDILIESCDEQRRKLRHDKEMNQSLKALEDQELRIELTKVTALKQRMFQVIVDIKSILDLD